MEEKLKTIQLEYDKSTFLIDLIKASNEQFYVSVEQIIHIKDNNSSQTIKINPSILNDIIETLVNLKNQLPKQITSSKRYFSPEKKEEVKKRYFKGVPIKDLALQFDCKESIIEQILTNDGIEIVSEMPKDLRRFKYKRRNKL